MTYKELHGIFVGTRAELLAKAEELTDRQLAITTDTGEVACGPGMFADLCPTGILVDIEVDAVATSNLTIATGLNAGDVIDNLTLVDGMKVLLTAQSTGSQNGVYVVGDSPARDEAMDEWDDFPQRRIRVTGGSDYRNSIWNCTNVTGGTLGTTAVTFSQMGKGAVLLNGVDQLTLTPAKTTVVDADVVLIQDSVTKALRKVALSDLKTYMSA